MTSLDVRELAVHRFVDDGSIFQTSESTYDAIPSYIDEKDKMGIVLDIIRLKPMLPKHCDLGLYTRSDGTNHVIFMPKVQKEAVQKKINNLDGKVQKKKRSKAAPSQFLLRKNNETLAQLITHIPPKSDMRTSSKNSIFHSQNGFSSSKKLAEMIKNEPPNLFGMPRRNYKSDKVLGFGVGELDMKAYICIPGGMCSCPCGCDAKHTPHSGLRLDTTTRKHVCNACGTNQKRKFRTCWSLQNENFEDMDMNISASGSED